MTQTPDTDNGYTRIAHEILDELARTDLSGGARRVLDVVMRQTWGYQKKMDWISLSRFETMTRMGRKSVCRCINELEERGILVTKRTLPVSEMTLPKTEYGFNKHINQWKGKKEGSVQTDTRGSVQNVPRVVSKRTHTIDNITKDNYIGTNVPIAEPGKTGGKTPAPTPPVSDGKLKDVPPHLEPLAMFAILFDVRFPSREEWSVFIKRNSRLSKTLAALPVESLASAMVLAEEHWVTRKKDFPIRLETVHKFIDDVGMMKLSDALEERRQVLMAAFKKNKSAVFLPTSARV